MASQKCGCARRYSSSLAATQLPHMTFAPLSHHPPPPPPPHRAALKRAGLLLSMKHGIARLDNVWGVGGGQRPVVHLTNKMVLLLKEYLSSGDLDEAVRCLSELEVPHFHHEVVYQVSAIASFVLPSLPTLNQAALHNCPPSLPVPLPVRLCCWSSRTAVTTALPP